jgi:hypothetical protein
MLIVIHVLLALSAIGVSVFNLRKPTNTQLRISYQLAITTLISGVLLIIINNASVLRTCLTGIVFFAGVSMLNEFSRRKLALEDTE